MILLTLGFIIHILIAIGLLGNIKPSFYRWVVLYFSLVFIPFYMLSFNYYLNTYSTKLEIDKKAENIYYTNLYGSIEINKKDIYGIVKIDDYTLKVVTREQVFYLDEKLNKKQSTLIDELKYFQKWQGPYEVGSSLIYLNPLIKNKLEAEKIDKYNVRVLRGYSEYVALWFIVIALVNIKILDKILKQNKKLWLIYIGINYVIIPIQLFVAFNITTTIFLLLNPVFTFLFYIAEP